jgi:hypothetical protein
MSEAIVVRAGAQIYFDRVIFTAKRATGVKTE